MLLSDQDLKAEIDAGRLIFEPPLPERRIQAASIDITLHNVFWRSHLVEGPGIETTIDIDEADPYKYLLPIESDSIILEPKEFILAETAEAISIADDLVGWIEGKSGKARHGIIIHCTAPHIAPGWGRGKPKRITLEIVNHNHVQVKLRSGIPIAQLLVSRLTTPANRLYEGKHQDKGT